MELRYETVMEENNLSERELPQDAKNAIATIKSSLRLAELRENRGQDATQYYEKAKSFDNFVVKEILDLVNGDNTEPEDDSEESENEYEKLQNEYDLEDDEDDEDEEPNESKENYVPKGDAGLINKELSELYKNNKLDLQINEIQSFAPNCYETIFDCYEEGEQNGIETNEYSLIEYDKQKYKLTKI